MQDGAFEVFAPPGQKLLSLLPEIYSNPAVAANFRFGDERGTSRADFLLLFLGAVEKLLLGPAADADSFSERIDALHLLLVADNTPDSFIDWLSGWAGITTELEIGPDALRRLTKAAIPLYSIRGTRAYVVEMLRLCLDLAATVDELEHNPFQIGQHSTVGEDMWLGGGPPHSFRVTINVTPGEHDELREQLVRAHAVINRARPAHTCYELRVNTPRMQIGVHSTIGVDTVLSASEEDSDTGERHA